MYQVGMPGTTVFKIQDRMCRIVVSRKSTIIQTYVVERLQLKFCCKLPNISENNSIQVKVLKMLEKPLKAFLLYFSLTLSYKFISCLRVLQSIITNIWRDSGFPIVFFEEAQGTRLETKWKTRSLPKLAEGVLYPST